MVVAGIGCSGTVQNNMVTYGYHALHGRVAADCDGHRLCQPRADGHWCRGRR